MFHPFRSGARLTLSAAVVLSVCVTSIPTLAQDQPAAFPATQLQKRFFQLRNIKPSIVAFWLDPAHQPTPIYIQYATSSGVTSEVFESLPEGQNLLTADGKREPPKPLRLPGNGNGPVDLKLPAGIERLVTIDPQNILEVTGTVQGLNALEKLLPTLDVALVQYEIEANFYQLDRAALPETGLKFDVLQPETAYNFGSATALPLDFKQRIGKLVESKRALLLTAPRVTLIDGLGGLLSQTTSTPAVWNETPALPRPVDAPANVQTPQRVAYITTSIGIRTSVTRAADGLISVAVEPHLGTRTLSVTAKVREDQPFAIQMSPSTDARQIIIIVTPTRVRRAGDTT